MDSQQPIRNYKIIEKIGEGTFGSVFKVEDTNTPHENPSVFVMKTINTEKFENDEPDEIENEIKILSSLNNPYIVKYHSSFKEGSLYHIIMEYCDQGDLYQLIKRQENTLLEESKIWSLFIETCLGLEYLHENKILHRDIKTLNIFISKEGSIKIGDLGVAKILDRKSDFTNTITGSPYYLSPEMCEEKPYNAKSDIWSLGCVLYELCSFKHPFESSNIGSLVLRILRAKYEPIPEGYSIELKNLVKKMLHKSYLDRPFIGEILKEPSVVKKAYELNLFIPETSVIKYSSLKINPKLKSSDTYTKKGVPNFTVNLVQETKKKTSPRVIVSTEYEETQKSKLKEIFKQPPRRLSKDFRNSNRKNLKVRNTQKRCYSEMREEEASIVTTHKSESKLRVISIEERRSSFHIEFNSFLVKYKPLTALYYESDFMTTESFEVRPLTREEIIARFQPQIHRDESENSEEEKDEILPKSINDCLKEFRNSQSFIPVSNNSVLKQKRTTIIKRIQELEVLLKNRKEEINERISALMLIELYEFFKKNAKSSEDLTEENEERIENYIFNRIPMENYQVIYGLYKVLHLENEIDKANYKLHKLEREIARS